MFSLLRRQKWPKPKTKNGMKETINYKYISYFSSHPTTNSETTKPEFSPFFLRNLFLIIYIDWQNKSEESVDNFIDTHNVMPKMALSRSNKKLGNKNDENVGLNQLLVAGSCQKDKKQCILIELEKEIKFFPQL